MKKELALQEIQSIEIEILRHFRAFCNENNITFYLSNGTLLGAVKYGGFIPWDDDIDVFVPRKDYDRLIKIYKDSEKYKLFCEERENGFRFPFAKLCDRSTLKKESGIDNGVDLGIDIDIFPLDSCSAHICKKSVQLKIRIFQNGCILSKIGDLKGRVFYKRSVISVCRFLGYGFFSKRLKNLINREKTMGSTHSGCLMWPIYGEREIVPSDVFSKIIDVDFEGESYPAPVGYDIYLRSLYGEYEKDPPKDKQKTHHSFSAFKL